MANSTRSDDIAFGVNFSIVVLTAVVLLRAILHQDAGYWTGVSTVLFINSLFSCLLYVMKTP